jgi:hypothetical protein
MIKLNMLRDKMVMLILYTNTIIITIHIICLDDTPNVFI